MKTNQLLKIITYGNFLELFKGELNEAELRCAQLYQEAQAELKFDKTRENQIVLTWKSAIGVTIACCVNKEEFVFSEPYVFCSDEKWMTMPVHLRFPPDSEKGEIIQEEIQNIKDFCKCFSWDFEETFI